MKTKNIFKFIVLFIIFSSCVNDDDFSIPTLGDDKEYKNVKSLTEISELYQGSLLKFEEDITTFGYVVSSDKKGNFYKTISIQDSPENPTIGFEILIDDFNLNARYIIGRKIFIKLKGLFLSKKNDAFQIGVENTFRNGVDRISTNDYVHFIDRASEIATILPTEIKIAELSNLHINTLVKINNLQSEIQGLTYANRSNTTTVSRNFVSCDAFENIKLITSGFADFKAVLIPDKKGSITAVVTKLDNEFQFLIRDTNDVNLTEEYGCFNNPTITSVANIRDMFIGSQTTITESLKIKAVVTSDLSKGNISNKNVFIQDSSGAIALHFSDTYDFNLGDELEIAVGGLILTKQNSLLQLNLATSDIMMRTAGTLPAPENISFDDALTGDYESKLVSISGVQFKDITKNYIGINTLTSDCTNELKLVSVKTDAVFASNQVSDKKGTITGILTQSNGVELYIRDENDVDFTEDYDCSAVGGGTTTFSNLFFSEYAEGSSNNKYLEIYNPTTEEVDLSNYALARVSNDPTVVGEHEHFEEFPSDAKIPAKGVYIVAHSSANADILAKANYTFGGLSNGDDGFALVYGPETDFTVLDWLGDWNGDPGSGWSVAGVTNATKDHTLIRKSYIDKGNTDWNSSAGTDANNSEWIVKEKDDFSSLGIR